MNYVDCSNSLIPIPSLNNTGMLPDTTYLRLKQGLMSQNIANNCMSGGTCMPCNKCTMYPSFVPNVNYCSPSVPKSCPCLRYVYQY